MTIRIAPLLLLAACGSNAVATNGDPNAHPNDETHTNPTCTADYFLAVMAGADGLPDPELSATCSGGKLSLTTNEIPNHEIGEFPNARNPNSITAQNGAYELSLAPIMADAPSYMELPNPFGVGLNGVTFDPLAAEWWEGDRNSGWSYNALGADLGFDASNAHVQPTGAYHYHGVPEGLVALLDGATMQLVGYAADGFPVYRQEGVSPSYRVKTGTRPDGPGGAYDGSFNEDWEYVDGAGDLDLCNGRDAATPEYPEGTYHYYVTDEFPNFPRCHVGTPDASFILR